MMVVIIRIKGKMREKKEKKRRKKKKKKISYNYGIKYLQKTCSLLFCPLCGTWNTMISDTFKRIFPLFFTHLSFIQCAIGYLRQQYIHVLLPELCKSLSNNGKDQKACRAICGCMWDLCNFDGIYLNFNFPSFLAFLFLLIFIIFRFYIFTNFYITLYYMHTNFVENKIFLFLSFSLFLKNSFVCIF